MEGKKNLCAMIPAELHARIMAEKEEMKLGTLAEYVERIFAEHFEGGNDMQTERTLAVKISAELFDRLKEYLEKNHLKQKDFITQLISRRWITQKNNQPTGWPQGNLRPSLFSGGESNLYLP